VSALLWFLLGLGVMALELVLPGFVIIFFGIGAWITAPDAIPPALIAVRAMTPSPQE